MEDATRTCAHCGTPLPPREPGPGRPRIYCSDTCRASQKRETEARRRTRPRRLCDHCSQEYQPRRSEQRYCSATCRGEASRTRERYTRTCAACGAVFESTTPQAKYCSRDCQIIHRIETAATGCAVDGCLNKHRARGLCATHYNQRFQPERHRTSQVPCTVCGTPVEKVSRGDRRPVCSLDCRYYLTWGEHKSERDARLEAERRSHMQLVGPVRFNKTTEPPTTTIPSTMTRLISTQCRDCGTWFIDYAAGKNRRPAVTCSDTCARRWARHRRKFWVPYRTRLWIYRRDNWTCQLCQQPVTQDYDPNDMWSASLDHIIPQSHGGTHDPSNLRLAHRYCNAIRSDARLDDAWFISPSA